MAKSTRQASGNRDFFVFKRNTLEYNRVIHLTNGVFAIAMTLLMVTLDVPVVPAEQLAQALVDQLSQFIAFGISFLLVAIVWWGHHKFIATLGKLEPVIIAINLIFLSMVVMLPYTTNLIGNDPTVPAAAILFISVFLAMNILHLLMFIRAHNAGAIQQPMSGVQFRREAVLSGIGVSILLLTMILA